MNIAVSDLCLNVPDQNRIKGYLRDLGYDVVKGNKSADYVLVHFPLTVNADNVAGHVRASLPLLRVSVGNEARLLFFGGGQKLPKDVDRSSILEAVNFELNDIEDLNNLLKDSI